MSWPIMIYSYYESGSVRKMVIYMIWCKIIIIDNEKLKRVLMKDAVYKTNYSKYYATNVYHISNRNCFD